MESIKRLRKYANGPCVYKDQKRVLLEIAEAFEVEHAEAYAQAYDNGYDAGFASADDWCADHEEAMAEHGWVKLPVDADGVPIHVGDEIDPISPEFDRFNVTFMLLDAAGHWEVNTDLDGEWGWNELDQLRHHKPTVEDVLREFADKWLDTDRCTKFENEVVAEYAQRLRLAGDE